MATKRIPDIKKQNELFNKTIQKKNRAAEIRRDEDTYGDLRIGLYDIDSCIQYYFEEVIKPIVLEDNELIEVPTIYGSPERMISVQKDGYYRDKNGKIQCPLIMFKRSGMTKNRTLARNVDPNIPRVYKSYVSTYSTRNRYDAFSKLTNSKPTHEVHNIVIPDYVNLTYECIIWTNYVEQLNKVIEAINYAESSYWGDPERFKFYAVINDFSNQTEVTDGKDRMVKATFTITLYGYIISDALQKQLVEHPKEFTLQTIKIKEQTGTIGLDELQNRLYDPNNKYSPSNPYPTSGSI